jgi:hypothetical protein
MKYQELLVEYKELLAKDVRLRQEMNLIPKGYLVTKKIAGKEYLYLQYSVQGKKKSEYIREEDALRIQCAIARRDPVKAEIDILRREQTRLESAAQILDSNLYRTFIFLKQCAEMDAMPLEKRSGALSFARAMTALEGLSAKDETEQNLLLWASGQKLFSDFYMRSLQSYRVVEGM